MMDKLETNPNPDRSELRASVGMHVAVEIRDQERVTERFEFNLVPDKESNFSSGLISERAPLAQAIHDRLCGETVQYLPPSGTRQTVKILSIEPSVAKQARPAIDREQVLGEVQDRIARRESRQIALTTELHYGSIDPDGIKEE
jgi:hypothetical protein